MHSVEEYLATLPEGIDSYPETKVKGSLIRVVPGDLDRGAVARFLPPKAGALLLDPPPPNAWAPEVWFVAMVTAVYQAGFADAGGVPAWEAWVYAHNRTLLGGPLYRILFAVLSPERLMIGVQKRWSAFRRGSSVRIVEHGKNHSVLKLDTPPYLLNDLGRRALACAFRAAIELGGAKLAHVTLQAESPSSTMYDMRWG
jgi:hypothetical protein